MNSKKTKAARSSPGRLLLPPCLIPSSFRDVLFPANECRTCTTRTELPGELNRPLLRNYRHRTEPENLAGNHFSDLASQILRLLSGFEHFAVRNLNDELHTSLPESVCLQKLEAGRETRSLPPSRLRFVASLPPR